MSIIRRIHRVVRLDIVGAVICFSLLAYTAAKTPRVTQKNIAFRHALSFERMQNQTVQVRTSHGEGSGVIIKRGDHTFVWTAAHVARDVSDVEIHQTFHFAGHKAGEQVFPGRVICRLGEVTEEGIKGADGALIWVDAPADKVSGATWAEATPDVGEILYHVGNYGGGKNFEGSVTKGIVAQTGVRPSLSGWPWALVDQGDFTSAPGSSGGPVFNEGGQIVGLLVGGPGNAISCYVPVRAIYEAAQKCHVAWAVYGATCPPDKILEDAVTACKPPAKKEEPDILQIIIGAPRRELEPGNPDPVTPVDQ